MNVKPKLALRAYALLTFGPIIALEILRPQLGYLLWPASIFNGLLCSWLYRRIDRAERSAQNS
jgi:hypothetical protein